MSRNNFSDMTRDEAASQAGDLDAAFIAFVATNSTRTPWVVVLLFLLLANIAHPHVNSPLVWFWFAAAAAFSVYRAHELKTLQPGSKTDNVRILEKIASLSLGNGLLTCSYLVFFSSLTGAEQALTTLLLISLCTGAVGTTTGQPKVFWLYSAPMLLGLGVSWFTVVHNQDEHWIDQTTGLLIFLYGWVLHGLARATYQSFCESHAIRYNEHELNTRLKAAVAAAQEASQGKTRFLASASHDLRQPMHAISLLIASLTLRPLDARSREIVQLLESANTTLTDLFDSLLDLSKLDAGLVQPEKVLMNLNALAANCFLMNKENIESQGLRAILDVPPGPVTPVFSDKILITRILQNLIDNAIKFTPTGSITVGVKVEKAQVHLYVQDTGIGIPLELQSTVFQEYFQVGNAHRDRAKGLGLGLSIVQRLVAITGGRLELSSTSLGSRFCVSYPVADPGLHHIAQTRAVGVPSLPAQRFDALDVLIVDDDITVNQSAAALLQELGCHVVQASGTQEALERVQDWTPDLVLADFRLSDGDSGLKTIQALRRSLPHLPAVLISGDTAPYRLKEAADAHLRMLHKPLRLELLQQVLSEALSQKKITKAMTS